MTDFRVFVLFCNTGVLGVYRSLNEASVARRVYKDCGFKCLKVEEFTV